jgi:hypothetical protein
MKTKLTEEDIKKANNIPAVSRREIYKKTCEMMYDHYSILHIVDIETALGIIRGVLEDKKL